LQTLGSDPPRLALTRREPGAGEKRWPRLAREADHRKRRQKLHDFLRRRGFPAAIVQHVLTEVTQNAEEGEEA
jgi:SOS response regulatory protein OraA/RecX